VPEASMRLLDAGADVNAVATGGASVVEAAVIVGNIPFAMQAVSHGADLRHRDPQGRQVIHIAAATGDAAFVKLVLEKGGNPNALTVLPAAAKPVVVAAVVPPKPVAGAAPMPITGPPKPLPVPATPLQFAAKAGSVAAMKVLVDAGAKTNIKGPDGMTLAMAGAASGKLASMKYAYELDPHLDTIARGGRSIMHIAVNNKTAEEPEALVHFLIDKGAKLDVQDERHSTPGDDVNRGGAENIRVFFIQLLRDKGIVSLAH
jgi:ankyrin repeat protein